MPTRFALLLLALLPLPVLAESAAQELHATTEAGDKVILYPNGRWQYQDAEKAAAASKSFALFPDDRGCPAGSRGGLLGLGRCIPPDDEDYHRGSRLRK